MTVLALMVLGVILWYGLRQAEETALPEAEAFALGDVSALAYPQYTLDHDDGGAYWYLADDVFTAQAGDGLVLQLTGLSDVDGKPFLVNAFRREDGNLYALLLSSDFSSSATGDIRGWGSNTFAELHVIPGGDMTEQPWYGGPGDTRTDGYADYTVLENDGGSVTFLLEDGWLMNPGDFIRLLISQENYYYLTAD